jgi:hypothetical protein
LTFQKQKMSIVSALTTFPKFINHTFTHKQYPSFQSYEHNPFPSFPTYGPSISQQKDVYQKRTIDDSNHALNKAKKQKLDSFMGKPEFPKKLYPLAEGHIERVNYGPSEPALRFLLPEDEPRAIFRRMGKAAARGRTRGRGRGRGRGGGGRGGGDPPGDDGHGGRPMEHSYFSGVDIPFSEGHHTDHGRGRFEMHSGYSSGARHVPPRSSSSSSAPPSPPADRELPAGHSAVSPSSISPSRYQAPSGSHDFPPSAPSPPASERSSTTSSPSQNPDHPSGGRPGNDAEDKKHESSQQQQQQQQQQNPSGGHEWTPEELNEIWVDQGSWQSGRISNIVTRASKEEKKIVGLPVSYSSLNEFIQELTDSKTEGDVVQHYDNVIRRLGNLQTLEGDQDHYSPRDRNNLTRKMREMERVRRKIQEVRNTIVLAWKTRENAPHISEVSDSDSAESKREHRGTRTSPISLPSDQENEFQNESNSSVRSSALASLPSTPRVVRDHYREMLSSETKDNAPTRVSSPMSTNSTRVSSPMSTNSTIGTLSPERKQSTATIASSDSEVDGFHRRKGFASNKGKAKAKESNFTEEKIKRMQPKTVLQALDDYERAEKRIEADIKRHTDEKNDEKNEANIAVHERQIKRYKTSLAKIKKTLTHLRNKKATFKKGSKSSDSDTISIATVPSGN